MTQVNPCVAWDQWTLVIISDKVIVILCWPIVRAGTTMEVIVLDLKSKGDSVADSKRIKIEYFTDVLCIWAYGAQVRIDQLQQDFGDQVEVIYRFLPLFADTGQRIGVGWRDRGGYEGFNRHCHEIAATTPHVCVHPRLWLENPPASSTPAHLFLKAIQLLADEGQDRLAPGQFEAALWQVRRSFFEDSEDVGNRAALERIFHSLGVSVDAVCGLIDNGRAHAALQADTEARERLQVPGSPTLVLHEGRQRLYGNLGYRIIEANVRELLRNPDFGQASWC